MQGERRICWGKRKGAPKKMIVEEDDEEWDAEKDDEQQKIRGIRGWRWKETNNKSKMLRSDAGSLFDS